MKIKSNILAAPGASVSTGNIIDRIPMPFSKNRRSP